MLKFLKSGIHYNSNRRHAIALHVQAWLLKQVMWPLLAEATTYIYTITTIQLVYRHTHTHRRLFGALSLLLCCCGTATTILHGCCCSTPSFFVELTRVVPPPCAVLASLWRPPSHRRRATHTRTFWCCSSTRRRHLNPN